MTLAMVALFCPMGQKAKGDVDVSFDFFYNNLNGGSWIEVGDYGYCWQPDIAVSNVDWRPYADGYWAYTDLGWTWVSYEDFGWATYHYGRWARIDGYGWCWVPGRDEEMEWGPAWVSWRTGGDYIGWAPLPPDVVVHEGIVLSGHVDVEFDIGPAYYNFCPVRFLGEPVLRERIVPVAQNITYVQQTVNVTNITVKNKTVYNYGPNIETVNKFSTRPVQRLRLERETGDPTAAAKSGGLVKVQGDRLMVSAPMRVRKSADVGAPRKVKAKVASANFDRGWANVDATTREKLKADFKNQDPNKIRLTGPAGANAAQTQTDVQTQGAADTNVNGTLNDNRRGGHGKNNDRQRPGEPANPNANAMENTSGGDDSEAVRNGRHRGRLDKSDQSDISNEARTTNEAARTVPQTADPNVMSDGQHIRRNQLNQVNPNVPAGTANQELRGAQGQGLDQQGQGQGRRFRRVDPQGAGGPSGGPNADAYTGRGRQQGQQGQGAQGQQGGQRQGRGEGEHEGKHEGRGHKGEASPAPTP